MPSITFNDFSGGLDHRLPINVQDASRLWVLRNAYITPGKRIRKRPALKLNATGLDGSFGLAEINGQLQVFVDRGSAFVPPTGIGVIEIDNAFTSNVPIAPGNLLGIKQVVLFQGYPYVVAIQGTSFISGGITYTYPAYRHHYIDGGADTNIADVNCPNTNSIAVAASRIFAISGETVRYSAIGAARDWTTASDAGFLATGLQQNTRTACSAVGTFEDALVVFYPDRAQIWDVQTDPSANQIRKRIQGVGTSEPGTLASWASDLVFLSQYGFRSMTVTEVTDRIDDTDIGVPVDTLVTPDLAVSNALIEGIRIDPFGIWIPQLGQYWCFFDNGTTSKVWAYSYSRSSKIACWSEYALPVRVTAAATLGGKVYLRTSSTLYTVDATAFTDDGVSVPVEVQMAFQDAKSPGVEKQWTGAKFITEGTCSVAFKYDPRDQSKETISQTVTDDTRPEDMAPVEAMATELAPVFRHEADEAFELSQLSLYYQVLGTAT
jgi:hypothetical protein